MKVLIVDAYAPTSKRRHQFVNFRRQVLKAIRAVDSRHDIDPMEIRIKHQDALDPYLFEPGHALYNNPESITAFDQLDFVFIDGDAQEAPWSRSLAKLALLSKMCWRSNKCTFGSGLWANMLAYLCSTGGKLLRVLNPVNVHVEQIETFMFQQAASSTRSKKTMADELTQPGHVFLDRPSGDYFSFDPQSQEWQPRGNVGLFLHQSSAGKRHFGTIPTAARGSGRPGLVRGLGQQNYVSKLGELRTCVRLDALHHWALAPMLGTTRDFMILCQSKWNLDDMINQSSETRYQTLVDSRRGPVLIEYRNLMAAQFLLSSKYPESRHFLPLFIATKFQEILEREHIDHSYVEVMKGKQTRPTTAGSTHRTSTTKEESRGSSQNRPRTRPGTAPPRSVRHLASTGASSKVPSGTTQRSTTTQRATQSNPNDNPNENNNGPRPGETTLRPASPKKCRPLSAHVTSSRSSLRVKSTFLHQQEKSRTLFRSKPVPVGLSRSSGPAAPERNSRNQREEEEEEEKESQQKQNQGPAPRQSVLREHRVKPQKSNRPYSSYKKFQQLDKQHASTGFVSIRNGSPYISNYDQDRMEYHRDKSKWTAGPFRKVFGKATSAISPEAGIVNTGQYNDHLTARNILNRREQRERFIDPTKRFRC